MKATSKNHDGIIVIDLHPEEGIDNVGACLWMRVYLDPEHGQLLCDSDIGDYTHRWPETGASFLKLIKGMNRGSLLEKCCYKRKEYDADEIIESIKGYFEDYDEDEPDYKELQEFLEDIEGCDDVFDIVETMRNTSFDVGDAWECVSKSFTSMQMRFAEYFVKYIRPEAAKYISDFQKEEKDG